MDALVGGRWTVRALAGQGPMGKVYKAEDERGNVVCLKRLNSSVVGDQSQRDDVLTRAKALVSLESTGIVRLFDVMDAQDSLILVYEWVEGHSLRRQLAERRDQRRRMPVDEIIETVRSVCSVVSGLHPDRVHGGLKPENVYWTDDGPHLLDTGLYELLQRDTFIEAQRDAGGYVYLSPEVKNGAPVTPAADVYSLGAMLYELLTDLAHGEDAYAIEDVVEGIPIGLCRRLNDIIVKATADDPADRYGDVVALEVALSYCARSSGIEEEDPEGIDQTRPAFAPHAFGVSQNELWTFGDDAGEEESAVVPSEPPGPIESLISTDPRMDALGESVVELDSVDILDAASIQVARNYGGTDVGPAPTDFDDDVTDIEPIRVHGYEQPKAIPRTPTDSVRVPTRWRSGPWFLRSNWGFVLSIMLVASSALTMVVFLWSPTELVEPLVVEGQGTTTVSPAASPEPPKTKPKAVDATPVAPPKVVAPVEEKTVVNIGTSTVDPKAVEAPQATPVPTPTPAPTPAPVPAPAPTPKPDAAKAALTPPPSRLVEEDRPEPVKVPPPAPAPSRRVEAAPAPTVKPAPPPPPIKPAPPAPPPPTPPAKPAPTAKEALAAVKASEQDPDLQRATVRSDDVDSLRCPSGMRLIKRARFPRNSVRRDKIKGAEAVALARAGKAYCIDVYEYPGKGRMPRSRVNYASASGLCTAQNKRLCTGSEWTRACRGAGGAMYPYGKSFKGTHCNTEDDDGEERSVAKAGRFRRCKSRWAVYDMSGNVAEWTSDQSVRGGDYATGDEDAACNAGGRRAPGNSRPNIGFRCCFDFKE